MTETNPLLRGFEVKPNPDPSALATEQLIREISHATDLFTAQMKGEREKNEAARAGIRHEFEVRFTGLEREFGVRLDGVNREFSMIEDRRKEQKIDTQVAVNAALLAAKEAVKEQTTASDKSITKSETSAADQSRQQNATFAASLKGVTDTLADVKDRVGKMENLRLGADLNRTNQRLDSSALMAFVFGGVGMIVAVISVVVLLTR